MPDSRDRGTRPPRRRAGHPAGAALLLAAAAALAVTAVGAGRLALGGWSPLDPGVPGDPAGAVLALVWAAASLLAGWLSVAVLACLAAAAPGALGRVGRRVADRTTPALLRRLAGAALGGALLAGGAAPLAAVAAGGTSGTGGAVTWSARVDGSGLSPDLVPTTAATTSSATAPAAPTSSATAPPAPTPSATTGPAPVVPRPTASLGALAPAAPRVLPGGADTADGDVVVTPGDCLWRIAAAHLPVGADPVRVARATADWYATNRAVVGPDPDHIEPGQVLRAPDQAGGR